MRFPWQKQKPKLYVKPLHKLNTETSIWCRDARLLQVEGTGALKWEFRGKDDDYNYETMLTLRGTPLIAHSSPECPTCAGMLATGWGLKSADSPELLQISDAVNAPFSDLDTSITALSPLLELLPSGLYVIADGDCFPTDGGSRFFWDVPDNFSTSPATCSFYYNDEDLPFTFSEPAPMFLYPSQPRTRLNPQRVDHYIEMFRRKSEVPRAITMHCTDSMSVLLDGHHKACAAARLGQTLPCITIFSLNGSLCHYPRNTPDNTEITYALFGPFSVPASLLPGQEIPESRWNTSINKRPSPYSGRLSGSLKLPSEFAATVCSYPTARELGVVSALPIGPITDQDLSLWLASPSEYGVTLCAAMVYLSSHRDPRLKQTALICADSSDQCTPLRKTAFQHLAALKGDPDVEQYFIRYFTNIESADVCDVLTAIANRFWD